MNNEEVLKKMNKNIYNCNQKGSRNFWNTKKMSLDTLTLTGHIEGQREMANNLPNEFM